MRSVTAGLVLLVICSCTPVTSDHSNTHNGETAELEQQAGAIVEEFAQRLKPALVQAIGEGGLPNAVQVCSVQAPTIADALSKQKGWSVKRISAKARNSRAVPDAYEEKILSMFERRLLNEGDNARLVHGEVAEGEYRYLAAQRVQGLCLNCHGRNLDDDLAAILREYYPDDRAIGYELGDIRGAFSLRKVLH